jgi:hypothetical protein
MQTIYLGIAVQPGASRTLDVGLASHDGTYSIDFHVTTFKLRDSASASDSGVSGTSSPADRDSRSLVPISAEELPDELANFVINRLTQHRERLLYKFIGVGINRKALELSPQLAARLWQELDAVPLVFPDGYPSELLSQRGSTDVTVDEVADSMARKALM